MRYGSAFTCHIITYVHWYCILSLQALVLSLPPFPLSFPPPSPILPPFFPAQEELDSHIIHANPMPQFDSVFKPQLPHKATEIQPFTFEGRYQGKPTRETLVQQILQKEKVQGMNLDTFPTIHITLAVEYLQFGN